MTFFLGKTVDMPARGPDVAPPTNGAGVGAAFTTYFREIDMFNGATARTNMEKIDLAKPAGERIGIEKLNQWYTENDAGYDHLRPPPTSVDDFIEMHGNAGTDIILDMAREAAKQDPEAWKDVDLSQEGIDARVTEGLKASDAADARDLALSPNPIRNSLVGSLLAGVADPVNLAALPFGLGGGSLLRIMGREALINGAIEGIQQPTRARTAERLGREGPGFVESVAQGAIFGAAFGGIVDGIPRAVRALTYYREMKKVQLDPTMRPETQEAAIQGAEAAIVRGDDPLKATRRAVLSEPSPARAPLILDESLRVTPEPTALAPDPITSEPLPPTPGIQSTTDQVVAVGKSGIAKANKTTKEVLGWLKKAGGVEPTGWLGAELKARGLNHKTMPGLFKKGGRTEIDNIVADELDQTIPGISYRAGRDGTGNYIDRDGLLRVLDEELAPPRPQKAYDPRTSYADLDPEDRGFMVDLNARQFAEPDNWRETLAADIDAHLQSTGYPVTSEEIAEIKAIAASRGGDVDDLVYSVLARDNDEAEAATIRTMRGEAYGREVPWGDEAGMAPGSVGPGGGLAGESQVAPGNAPEAGAVGQPFPTERTAIGDQAVIPGTRRVDDYQKHVAKAQAEARAIQSKMRSGRSQERVEDDAGGLFGGAQRDMFSDPADPKSKPTQVAMMEDLRDSVTTEDFMVDVGNGPVPASSLLKELDDDLDFEDILNACGKRGPA